MKKIILLLFICAAVKSHAQNLVVNAGFEQPLATGWTIVSGNWEPTGAGYGYGDPNTGDYYATPKFIGSAKEMYRDVDVSAYTAAIDNGTGGFSFEAWLQVASNADTARAVIEYYNSTGNILAADSVQETVSNFNVWNLKTNNRVVPVGTRTIRIRLLAIPFGGFGDLVMFDDISLTATTILPLKLVYFTAVAERENARIEWQTDHEDNTSAFDIQSSADGRAFTTVKTIPAQGSNGHTYSTVLPLNSGTTHYRLKINDRDGRYSYSPVEKIKALSGTAFAVYPNPSTGTITLSVAAHEKATLNIYNSSGRLVCPSIILIGGSKTIDLAALPSGWYRVQMTTATQTAIQTLIINH